MTIIREHFLQNRKAWKTNSDGPCVMVPIDQIDGMTPEQIGEAVLELRDEARVSELLEMYCCFNDYELPPLKEGEKDAAGYNRICMRLGANGAEGMLDAIFRQSEYLRELDDEIEEHYQRFCKLLDGAHHYLLTKKGKLTPSQQRAKTRIIELRHGCPLCGLLAGNHTEACLRVQCIQASPDALRKIINVLEEDAEPETTTQENGPA